MTPDELKAMPKGQFIVMKTGFYPMKVRLKLFFRWGIQFDEKHPYAVADQGNRIVQYAERKDILDGIVTKYRPDLLNDNTAAADGEASGGQTQLPAEHNMPQERLKKKGKEKSAGSILNVTPKSRRDAAEREPPKQEVKPDGQP